MLWPMPARRGTQRHRSGDLTSTLPSSMLDRPRAVPATGVCISAPEKCGCWCRCRPAAWRKRTRCSRQSIVNP